MNDYQPIACAIHEQYQYAVLKRAWLDLEWEEEAGGIRSEHLLPKDVQTRNRAEYLLAESRTGSRLEIRLDRIKRASWVEGGVKILG